MSNHTPIKPPEFVFDYFRKNWVVDVEKGAVFSKSKQAFIGSLDTYGYHLVYVTYYRFIRRSHIVWFHACEWPPTITDHINLVRSDDRVENLKLRSSGGNSLNQLRSLNRELPPHAPKANELVNFDPTSSGVTGRNERAVSTGGMSIGGETTRLDSPRKPMKWKETNMAKIVRKLPDLSNATPSFLIDEIGKIRAQNAENKFMEGVYRKALDARLATGQKEIEGDIYVGELTTNPVERIKADLVREILSPEDLKKVMEVGEVTTLRLTKKDDPSGAI